MADTTHLKIEMPAQSNIESALLFKNFIIITVNRRHPHNTELHLKEIAYVQFLQFFFNHINSIWCNMRCIVFGLILCKPNTVYFFRPCSKLKRILYSRAACAVIKNNSHGVEKWIYARCIRKIRKIICFIFVFRDDKTFEHTLKTMKTNLTYKMLHGYYIHNFLVFYLQYYRVQGLRLLVFFYSM